MQCRNSSCRWVRITLGMGVFLLLGFHSFWSSADSGVTGQRGAVATVHPLATESALQAMAEGGNAIDAAVAAALTLGVVDGHNSGIGGGCFMMIRLADRSIVALDGREQAPSAARRDMFVKDGKARPDLSQTGALAVGIPGALAVYEHAVRNYGRLPLSHHLRNAARFATNGFAISTTYAERLGTHAADLEKFPSSRAVLLKPDGTAYRTGELLKQPELAAAYQSIATHGIQWFYEGPFALEAERWMSSNGGLITAQDFRRYEFKSRQPILTTYRGFQILGFPPPSSGGVHVAQILNILESFNLRRMRLGSADFIHVVTEAMKLAFADRAYWLGDPAFAPVPRGLIAKKYAAHLAERINMKQAMPVPNHDVPEEATDYLFQKHTTHFSTADGEGNWVACTATVNTSFGSKVIIPGTGVILNNQMDDFSIQPGVTNFFGLLGGDANAVQPGKRPLSSMSPTLVLKEGRPILSVGAAGGPTIISQALLAVLYTVDFGLPFPDVQTQLRFHHQWQPDVLQIERSVAPRVRRELERRGHKLKLVNSLGAMQGVGVGGPKRLFVGASDPRGEGSAGAF